VIRVSRVLPGFVRRRVGLQLVAVCGTVLASAALVSARFTAAEQKRLVLAEVERQGQMLAKVAAIGSVEAFLVENNDLPALETILDFLLATEHVKRAQIVRADGKVVASSGQPCPDVAVYEAPILPAPGGRPVGRVRLELSMGHAEEVAAASTRLLFQQWAIAFLALATALGLVFRFVVHGRLDRLAQQALRLGRGDLETPIILKGTDELGQLATTLDSVRCRLRESYRRLSARNVQLQEIDKLKSEFMANVSHEIRTPLNGILGFAELVLQRPLETETAEMLDTIFRSAHNLRRIVDDVLEFSRLESGEVSIKPEPVDPRELLADVADLHGQGAWCKGVETIVDVAPDVPARILADPLRLQQVIGNLLNNAVKFTSEGEIVLRAETVNAPGGSLLRVTVLDTGIGFEPSVRSTLFDSFRQADGSVSRRFGGTGLGLAIARHLVHRMGGSIDADSVPNVGSRFWIDLPAQRVDVAEPAPEVRGPAVVIAVRESLRLALGHALAGFGCPWRAAGAIAGATSLDVPPRLVLLAVDDAATCGSSVHAVRVGLAAENARVVLLMPPGSVLEPGLNVDAVVARPVRPSRLLAAITGRSVRASTAPAEAPAEHRLNVLVVDDNLVNRRVAMAMLKRLGHQGTAVETGAGAVDILAQRGGEFDVVLMDCQMPDVDGFEATRRIRALPGSAGMVRIVACTASSLAGDVERCRIAGMDDYLPKPFDLANMRRVLERSAPSGAAHAPVPHGIDSDGGWAPR